LCRIIEQRRVLCGEFILTGDGTPVVENGVGPAVVVQAVPSALLRRAAIGTLTSGSKPSGAAGVPKIFGSSALNPGSIKRTSLLPVE
jgi:hypothetical protein